MCKVMHVCVTNMRTHSGRAQHMHAVSLSLLNLVASVSSYSFSTQTWGLGFAHAQMSSQVLLPSFKLNWEACLTARSRL